MSPSAAGYLTLCSSVHVHQHPPETLCLCVTFASLVYETRLFKKMDVECEHICTLIYLKLYIGHPHIALAQVIHHIVQTWPQVIFTCSEHLRNKFYLYQHMHFFLSYTKIT